MKFILFLITLSALTGCATRAPSTYELSRRSGLSVAADSGETKKEILKRDVGKIRTGTAMARESMMPARVPAVIEKVWVYDQIINGGQWLQGTWVFIEVEKARWLPEIDSGHGSFLETGTVTVKPKTN